MCSSDLRYLRLLEQAGLLSGLRKYSGRVIETKGTIPKLQVHNTALLSAMKRSTFSEIYSNPMLWGHIAENSVGAYLVDQVSKNANASLYYWRDGNSEIDYVIAVGEQIIGIEVKSGYAGIPQKAVEKFKERFPKSKVILVGKNGLPYEVFMKTEIADLFYA